MYHESDIIQQGSEHVHAQHLSLPVRSHPDPGPGHDPRAHNVGCSEKTSAPLPRYTDMSGKGFRLMQKSDGQGVGLAGPSPLFHLLS